MDASASVQPVENQWVYEDYAMAISAISLVVSAVALAILLCVIYPMATPLGRVCLYCNYALLGASFITFAVSSAAKIYRKCSEEPLPPLDRYTYQNYQETLGANWGDISVPDQVEHGPLTRKIEWPVRISPQVLVHGSTLNPEVVVFEMTSLEGLIFKRLPIEKARALEKTMHACALLTKENGLHLCKVPRCELIVLDNQPDFGMLVIEKMEGIHNPLTAQEASERVYDRFHEDPRLMADWMERFRQATAFICLTGYAKVNWREMLLVEEGFGFVDFEGCEIQTPYAKVRAKIHLSRLIDLAHPDLEQVIVETASLYEVSTKRSLEEKQSREAHLAFRSEIRRWHKERGILNPKHQVPVGGWTEGSIESKVIEKINSSVLKQGDDAKLQGCLIEQRCISFVVNASEEEAAILAFSHLKYEQVLFGWKKKSIGNEKKFWLYSLYC